MGLGAARFVVVDVETTGLRPGFDKLTEVAALALDGDLNGISYTSAVIDPEVEISSKITQLTGIDQGVIRREALGTARDVLPQFMAYIGPDAVIVAHNAGFDLAFLRASAERELGGVGAFFGNRALCTMALAQSLLPGRPSYRLKDVQAALGVPPNPRAHRALTDATACAMVFARLVDLARSRGVTDLFDIGGGAVLDKK